MKERPLFFLLWDGSMALKAECVTVSLQAVYTPGGFRNLEGD